MISILSLTYLDEDCTNAQQANAQEVIRRLAGETFRFTAFAAGPVAEAFTNKPSIRVVRVGRHFRSLSILYELRRRHQILWYPSAGPAEALYFLVLRKLQRRRRRPFVVAPMEGDAAQYDEIDASLRKRLEIVVAGADLLVPITNYVRSTVSQRFGRDGPVIPVGVDTSLFRPPEDGDRPDGKKVRVLSVGTLKAWKRPELVLVAARAFPKLAFRIVGDGPLERALRAEAPENVEFLGRVARPDLPVIFKEADILLHPSRMEGMPKVVLEGMAAGCVPVVFDQYQPEFLRSEESGLIVRTVEEMLSAVDRLASDRELRQRLGEGARLQSLQFDWDVVAKKWGDLFSGLCARTEPSGMESARPNGRSR